MRTRSLSWLWTLALLAGGCVSVNWERDSWSTPPADGVLEGLLEGHSALAEVLERLGAPLDVREHRRDGLVLLYGWREVDGKRLNVSGPVTQDVSASFDYSRGRRGLRGVLLLFDADWRLASAREGWLDDLSVRRARRQPTLVEEEEP